MPLRKQSHSTSVHQLKVTLRDTKPPIWRRIQVTSDTTLAKLHEILQIVMGWTDSHLHQFVIDQEYYGVPLPDFGFEVKNEKRLKLGDIASGEKRKFAYEYDFGDGWQHEIVVEKILPVEAGKQYPICITGKRACPPEDIGGTGGYDDFVEAIKDPRHPQHEEMLEWAGGSFDAEAFDVEAVNRELKIGQ
jgi:Plasmid pRiA4b ORF-3-like protein